MNGIGCAPCASLLPLLGGCPGASYDAQGRSSCSGCQHSQHAPQLGAIDFGELPTQMVAIGAAAAFVALLLITRPKKRKRRASKWKQRSAAIQRARTAMREAKELPRW